MKGYSSYDSHREWTEAELAELADIYNSHDPERTLSGRTDMFSKDVTLADIKVASTSKDFMEDLERGAVDASEKSEGYAYDASCKQNEANMEDVFGFQVISRMDACDKNFNPLGWKDVQARLGLDSKFDVLPTNNE